MKYMLMMTASLLAAASLQAQDVLRMLVGTYTENTSAEGVYLYSFDQETAEAVLLDTAKAGNPSFVIPSPDRRFAYAVSEFGDGRQGACAFRLGEDTVDFLNWQPSAGTATGADPCNILYWNGNVITSNYTGGSVSVFPVGEDGRLGPMREEFSLDWSYDSELASRLLPETVSHMHCAVLSPDGKYLFVTDLGAECIHRFTLSEDRVLGDHTVAYRFPRLTKTGPRHMVFSADGNFAYLISELGDLLTVFKYWNGQLETVHSVKAYTGNGHGSADIHLSPDGRFLYTSHRLKEDGIAVFSVDPVKGRVKKIGYTPTGSHPRNFALTPNGKYLLCACRDTDAIEIYSVDARTGLLTDTGKRIEVGAPVCISFFYRD